MRTKPWYVPNDQWQTSKSPDLNGLPEFDQRLARIIKTADNETQSQQRLTLELVREVNQIRWILVWMLVLVPVILVTMTIILAITSHAMDQNSAIPTLDGY
jgi:hypothetical protein